MDSDHKNLMQEYPRNYKKSVRVFANFFNGRFDKFDSGNAFAELFAHGAYESQLEPSKKIREMEPRMKTSEDYQNDELEQMETKNPFDMVKLSNQRMSSIEQAKQRI